MKIDFYVLDTTNRQKSHFFACRLLEKLYTEQQKTIFIQTNAREDADRFDALLWTYRDDGFLPHNLATASEDNNAPIQIGFGEAPAKAYAILLNLSNIIPPFYTQFEHVIEIVFSDPLVQQLARERYKQYRDQGYEINTIKLKADEHD